MSPSLNKALVLTLIQLMSKDLDGHTGAWNRNQERLNEN